MGNGRCSFSSTYNIFFSINKKNLIIILITVFLYIINQKFKVKIPNEDIKWFMSGYFNDVIGSMTFISYCNIIFSFRKIMVSKLWQIELLMFSCGVFWEFVTPLYRTNTVTDGWDIIAYMLGGILYWIIIRKEQININ